MFMKGLEQRRMQSRIGARLTESRLWLIEVTGRAEVSTVIP